MNKLLLLLLFFTSLGFSQVGVNTTTPDASSMLDVAATNKGVLFPRVSLSNINVTQLDGVNTAATGLLIWNTNATTVGGNGVGYYYFNGAIWVPVSQIGSNDHDWYEIGTTVAPNAITDNMFHTGNMVIGKSTITSGDPKVSIQQNNPPFGSSTKILDLEDISTTIGSHFGLNIDMNSTSSTFEYGISVYHENPNATLKFGVFSSVSNGSGTNSAFQGRVLGTGLNQGSTNLILDSGSPSNGIQIGSGNVFRQPTTSFTYGHKNQFETDIVAIDTGTKYGVFNTFGGDFNRNVGGELYGFYNEFKTSLTSTTNKYGSYTLIPSTLGGTHYGIYSSATKTGSYSGYFLGNVSVGTTITNNYILPSSRGTLNQIMQTDGVGNAFWANPPVDTDGQNIDVLSLTGDVLNISLQNDGVTTQTLNLATIDNQATDVFSLTGNTLNLSLQNDGVATQTVDLSSLKDHDWYAIGGTTQANSINDNIYTIGDVVIGKATPALAKLDVQSNAMLNTFSLTNANTSVGVKNGIENTIDMNVNNNLSNAIRNNISGLALFKNGLLNQFNTNNLGATITEIGVTNNFSSSGSSRPYGFLNLFAPSSPNNATITGLSNELSSNNQTGSFYGITNLVSNTSSTQQVGLYNAFNGSGNGTRTGVETSINNATGTIYGSKISISSSGTGIKFGEEITISSTSGGTHYGIYSDVTKSNSFAGYFLGRISIGTTTTDNYILPPSRGTNGQIIRTDGAGNVSWVNPPSDADWHEIGTTNPPNAITDNIFTQGNVAIGKNTISNDTKVDIDNNDKDATLTLLNTKLNFGGGWNYGIHNTLDSQGNEKAILNELFSLAATSKIGQHNFFQGDAIASVTGCFNEFENGGAANQIGINNQFSSTSATGNVTGVRNWFPSSSNYTNTLIGNENDFDTNNNGEHTAISNIFTGTGSGIKYGTKNLFSGVSNGLIYSNFTDITTTGTGTKYGTYNKIASTSGGLHYGVYSDVIKSNSYAGYFLGRISIGTTTTDNYILPLSRGTINQIMQTNAAGIVTWVNPPIDNDNQNIDVLSLTGNTMNISLQDDAVATQTIDLSPIANTHWTDVTTHIQPTIASKSVVIGDALVAPTAKLSVKTDSAPATPQIEIVENQANDDAKIKFSNAFETLNDWSIFARADDTPASNLFNINHTIGGNIVRINGEGRVGIMRTAATNELEVGGNASKTTAGAWLANSDSRLKKNITTISPSDALNKVLSLRGVNYEWNDDKTGMKRPEGNQIGFVAQEIQEVFPEKVNEDKQGYLQTAYGDYDPIIFQAIKALNEKMQSLNEKIETLEKENEELKKLMKK